MGEAVKKITLTCFFITVLLMSSFTLAQSDVSLVPSTDEMTIFGGESKSVGLTVENNQTKTDIFSVSVWPSYWAGVITSIVPDSVKASSSSTGTSKLTFTVDISADEMDSLFKVSATSTTDKTVTDSQNILLRVKRKTPVYVSDLKLDKYTLDPGNSIKIDISIINLVDTPSGRYIMQTVVKSGKKIVERFDDTVANIPGKSTEIVSHIYTFGRYAEPGAYSIESTLKDSMNKVVSIKSVEMRVNSVYKIPTEYTEKTTDYSVFPLWLTTTIRIKNDGNVASPSFQVTERIPAFAGLFFDPEIEPLAQTDVDGSVVYSWLIQTLEPGEEITIMYKFVTWTMWMGVLVIIGCATAFLRYFYAMKIFKRYKHKGPIESEKEIPIMLEVKNRTRHEIKNVVVKDVVPSIAQLVKKFETLTPEIKDTAAGTELIWKIKSLRPKEERILTYRIKPIVEIIGTMKLSKAYMAYIDKKKEKKVIASKRIAIKPK